jgi:hypothetical protein
MDICDFRVSDKYDFIYSISTFEHMDSDGGRNTGYKREEVSPFTSVALQNVKIVTDNLLKDNGKFVLTFPLEYCNAEIDKSYHNKEFNSLGVKNVETWIFWKKNELEWIEINYEDYKMKKYRGRFTSVNFLCVVELTK